jgi:hypothetical protein
MSNMLNSFERQLCDIQGRLFELSLKKGLDSNDFINKFMTSKTCEFFDMPYDRLQWAGEEYILETLLEEAAVQSSAKFFGKEELYWTGYVYRYWHFLTGESSRDIYSQADAAQMKDCYLGFHTLDVAMAIDDLKEINRQNAAKMQ